MPQAATFFVIQRVETGKDKDGKPVYSYGITHEIPNKADAEAQAVELAKTAPGVFFVAKAISATVVEPRMEATT